MFEFLPQSDGRYVAVKVTGTLDDADYHAFMPKLATIIAEKGPIRLLLDLTEFKGWTAGGAWSDLGFELQHRRDFERIAIVGDGAWDDVAMRLRQWILHAEVRQFPAEDWWIAWDYILDLS